MEEKTSKAYDRILSQSKELFIQKTLDYGTAWRILRLPSITDQIFIKAQRIRSIQEKGTQKVQKLGDKMEDEFIGIINYCIMAMIQMELLDDPRMELSTDVLVPYYDQFAKETKSLLIDKNHDYGEAWREMRLSSITDIILMKLLRVKQIENNQGETRVSEGIKANYQDMINYAVFSLIKIEEGDES